MTPYKRLEQLEDIIRHIRLLKIERIIPTIQKKIKANTIEIARTRIAFEILNVSCESAGQLWAEEQTLAFNPSGDKRSFEYQLNQLQIDYLDLIYMKKSIYSSSVQGKNQ